MEKLTLQKVLRQHLDGVLKERRFPLYQLKALRRLSECRTAALGGHAQYCEAGHLNGVWYNSCKHRSCPQCRGMASEEWLRHTQNVLLDCPHHHIIFTLPSEINTLWRYNRALLSGILFKAAQETLLTFARDPKYLAATPGILSALHTWGRNLSLHPHLHVLVSHGGLDKDGTWRVPRRKHLFPQKPVMRVFRGKFRALVKEALTQEQVSLPQDLRAHQVQALLNKLGRKEWVVHFCERYDYASGVAKYLARYVKGGPFNNGQLCSVSQTHLQFKYKSHETKRIERLSLPIGDFVRRWAEHAPLPGKPSVRYCGLYSSSARNKLNQARQALSQSPVSERQILKWQAYLEDLGKVPACALCGRPLSHGGPVPDANVG